MVREPSRARSDRLDELRRARRVRYIPRSRKTDSSVIRTFRLERGLKLERVVKGTH
jgi:hypothetical protein